MRRCHFGCRHGSGASTGSWIGASIAVVAASGVGAKPVGVPSSASGCSSCSAVCAGPGVGVDAGVGAGAGAGVGAAREDCGTRFAPWSWRAARSSSGGENSSSGAPGVGMLRAAHEHTTRSLLGSASTGTVPAVLDSTWTAAEAVRAVARRFPGAGHVEMVMLLMLASWIVVYDIASAGRDASGFAPWPSFRCLRPR